MDLLRNLSRRNLVKWGLLSAGAPMFSGLLAPALRAQDAGSEAGSKGEVGGRSEEELFPAKGLPGGGQLEIRLTQTMYTSDPDQLEVAQRMKPFNLESWIVEWTRVAERNEQLAEKAVSEGYKTDGEHVLPAGFELLSRGGLAAAGDRIAHAADIQQDARHLRESVATDQGAVRKSANQL